MKIVVLSDSPTIPTGYRNQMVLLTKYLQKRGHEIFYMANGYIGSHIDKLILEGGEEFNYKIWGHDHTNPYFNRTMSEHLRRVNADRFVILLDTFMLYGANFLNIDTAPAKTFFWFPSDGGGGLPKDCLKILQKVHVPVAMSEFGQKQVKDYYGLNTKFIPHGVNSKEFFPLPEQEKLNLKRRCGIEGKFVIGVVARNQPRKNLDRTVKVMKIVAERLPNAVLYLHLDPNDPAQPLHNIHELVKKFGIENRVIYSGMTVAHGFPQSKMNEVYNLMDVFLLTTSGEGFGIPIIEAMSCEIPVVATDYTTTPELVKKNNAGMGIKLAGVEEIDLLSTEQKEYDIKVLDGTMTGSWEVERGFCSVHDAANKIVYLYENPNVRKLMGSNGRKAVINKYDFETKIGPAWEEVLK